VDSAGEPTGPNDPVFQGVARSSVTSFRVRHPSNQGVVLVGRWWVLFISAREDRKGKKIKVKWRSARAVAVEEPIIGDGRVSFLP
jgi:hypothetical protein